MVGHWRKQTLSTLLVVPLFCQVYFAVPLLSFFFDPHSLLRRFCLAAQGALLVTDKHRMLFVGKSRLIAASHPKGIHPTSLHMHTIHLHMHTPHTSVRCTRQMVLNTEMRFLLLMVFFDVTAPSDVSFFFSHLLPTNSPRAAVVGCLLTATVSLWADHIAYAALTVLSVQIQSYSGG